MSTAAPRILVGHVSYPNRSSYLADWLETLLAAPGIAARGFNIATPRGRATFAEAVPESDAIVLLHACVMDTLDFVAPLTTALAARHCRLAAFVGNEYNTTVCPMRDRIAWLAEVGADIVATQLPQRSGDWLYETTGARVLELPHALNPRAFTPPPAGAARPIDVGTISFSYPAYFGDTSRMRTLQAVAQAATAKGLTTDIRTSRRLDRAQWAAFLASCRWTVATEAGAPHVDRDDRLAFEIRDFIRASRGGRVFSPNHALRFITRRLPWSVKERLIELGQRAGWMHEGLGDDRLAEEIHARFFAGRTPAGVPGRCISARHFDAIGTDTPQVLLAGDYNGILEAGRHYVAIAPDLSNLDAVVETMRDDEARAAIARACRDLALGHHTIAHRIATLLEALGVPSAPDRSA